MRATHVASGVSVRGQSQRRLQHGQTERGNARRTFVGQRFIEAQRGAVR